MYGVNHTADAVNTTLLGYPYKPGNRAARLALAAFENIFFPKLFFWGVLFWGKFLYIHKHTVVLQLHIKCMAERVEEV